MPNTNEVFGKNNKKPIVSINDWDTIKSNILNNLFGIIPGSRAMYAEYKNPDISWKEYLDLLAEDIVPSYANVIKPLSNNQKPNWEGAAKEAVLLAMPGTTKGPKGYPVNMAATKKFNSSKAAQQMAVDIPGLIEERPLTTSEAYDLLVNGYDQLLPSEFDNAIIHDPEHRNIVLENRKDAINEVASNVQDVLDEYRNNGLDNATEMMYEYNLTPDNFSTQGGYYSVGSDNMLIKDYKNLAPEVYNELNNRGYKPAEIAEVFGDNTALLVDDPKYKEIINDPNLSQEAKQARIDALVEKKKTEMLLDDLDNATAQTDLFFKNNNDWLKKIPPEKVDAARRLKDAWQEEFNKGPDRAFSRNNKRLREINQSAANINATVAKDAGLTMNKKRDNTDVTKGVSPEDPSEAAFVRHRKSNYDAAKQRLQNEYQKKLGRKPTPAEYEDFKAQFDSYLDKQIPGYEKAVKGLGR